MLLLAIPESARAGREKARHVVEDLLLPAIDLVRANAVPLRQLRHRRYLVQGVQSNFGFELLHTATIACHFVQEIV